MTTAQYSTPITHAAAQSWGDSRETHPAIVMAIHAISSKKRPPMQIWAEPTETELDHVIMAVQNYVEAGVFDADPMGRYSWGNFTIKIVSGDA